MKYILVVITIIFYFAQLTKADKINGNEAGSRVKRQIYGGKKVKHDMFPFLVYLRRNGWNKPNWLPALVDNLPFISDWFSTPFHCGGVIITKRFVLTAAHCIVGDVKTEVKRLEVVAGTNQLEHPEAKNVEAYGVEAIAVHTVPGQIYLNGDIAVIRVKKNFDFSNPNIGRAKLPPSNYKVTPNTKVYIGGWGVTESDDDPLHLHYLHMRVASTKNCRFSWKTYIQSENPFMSKIYNYEKIIEEETMMCVFAHEGQGVCNGDSGGGALTSDGTVLGIVSFGATPCGNSHIIPDVMTYVPHYVHWIREKMVSMIPQVSFV